MAAAGQGSAIRQKVENWGRFWGCRKPWLLPPTRLFLDHPKESVQEVKQFQLILIFEAEIYFQVKFTFHTWHSIGTFFGLPLVNWWTMAPEISNMSMKAVAQRLWSKAYFSGGTKRNQWKHFNWNRKQKSLSLEDVEKEQNCWHPFNSHIT